MNKKRIVAFMAAATMLLNVTPVMAATATSGSTTVSGSGTVSAYDKTPIFQVTLPTANALDFTVDPYGLLDLASGSSVSIDQLANSGAIKSASGAAAIIMNESSVPVTVKLTMNASQPTASKTINFKSVGSEVATGDAVNMFLAIIPSAEKADSVASYKAASYAIPVTGSPSDASFKLDKAKYEVVNNNGSFKMQIVSQAANYDATVFKVGGVVNPNADWGDFTDSSKSSVALNVVFSYEQSKDTDVVNTSAGVYGLVSGSATLTNDMGASAAISGTGMTKSNESGIDYEVTGFSISKAYTIKIEDGRTVTALKSANDATFAGALTLNSSNINATNKTVTIPTGTFGAAAVGNARYVKLVTSKGDLVIKLKSCAN